MISIRASWKDGRIQGFSLDIGAPVLIAIVQLIAMV